MLKTTGAVPSYWTELIGSQLGKLDGDVSDRMSLYSVVSYYTASAAVH